MTYGDTLLAPIIPNNKEMASFHDREVLIS